MIFVASQLIAVLPEVGGSFVVTQVLSHFSISVSFQLLVEVVNEVEINDQSEIGSPLIMKTLNNKSKKFNYLSFPGFGVLAFFVVVQLDEDVD